MAARAGTRAKRGSAAPKRRPGQRDTPWRPFLRARTFVQALGLTSGAEWQLWCQGKLAARAPRPPDIPTNPNKIYRDAGWVGMGDWLGTGRVAHQKRAFRSFEAARRYARSLGLHSFEQWRAFCKGELDGRPPPPTDIPHSPYNVYVNRGWISWGDFLGSGRVAPSRRRYRSFTRARAFARRLGLGGRRAWVDYCAHYPDDGSGLPDDIPTNPNLVYRDQGWAGWGDFLGTGNLGPKRVYRSFPRARAFARKLGLDRRKDWQAFARGERSDLGARPRDIPSNPDVVYRELGWIGWEDFLGSGRYARTSTRARPPSNR